MIKTTYQTPELRNANDEVVQEGSFGKNTALTNSTNDGWIDYVMNDLEALHDTIGDSAPTLDGNGHVVEPANLAIGDEDGVRLKTGYVKTSGGTVSGTLNIAQNLKMQDNQENVFGGIFVPGTTSTQQYVQFYGGPSAANTDVGSSLLLFSSGDGHFTLRARSADNSAVYDLNGNNNGTLTWRGQEIAVRNSPSFTGNPTAPTQAVNNNSTRLATTEYVVNDLKRNTWLVSDTFAEIIPNGADLDSYITAGTYKTVSAAATDSLSNCPVSSVAFKLIVQYNGYSLVSYSGIQILITSLGRVYVRGYNGASGSGSWGSWRHIAYAEDVLPLTGGTITGNIIREASSTPSPIVVQRTDIERGVELTGIKYNTLLSVFDKNGFGISNRLAVIENTMDATNTRMYLTVWKNTVENTQAQIYLEIINSNAERTLGPTQDNAIALGKSSQRWKQLFAGTTTISTSDERLKDNITDIPDAVLDAWGEVGWYQYQFKDSIAEKGETKARIHTGAIAQRIESIFESHGLDANKYGLLCYDEWKAEPAERDEQGNIVQPARPAGNRYSLRYEEALCMEAAYQRRRADRLEQRLNAIEQRLSALETL